jgi:predicted HD phosphohydrolase
LKVVARSVTDGSEGAPASKVTRSPLYREDWSYIERAALNDFSAEEFALLNEQRRVYYAEHQVGSILAMMRAARPEPSFGYQVNHYEHGLQSATMLFRDGYEPEDVVVGLLHDIGFITCPDRHGAFAAELLGAYVSERNVWMLRHHQSFGSFGASLTPGTPGLPREKWRDHPYYGWTLTFVEEYDQNAIDPQYENLPLEFFEPFVQEVFARKPHAVPPQG